MKKISELNLESLTQEEYKDFRNREAVRAIVVDENGKVVLVHVGRDNYYKIPGGGIDKGEDKIEALKRECMEEAGVHIKENPSELGYIFEAKRSWEMTQTSYCYIAEVEGEKKEPEYTSAEQRQDFSFQWIEIHEAIKLMKSNIPDDISLQYMARRDLIFMEAYKNSQKVILVDAVNTFVDKETGMFQEMYELLEQYPNKKIVLTNADDEQMEKFGLNDLPYEVFTLKHNPNKPDPVYFQTMLKHFDLKADEVIYFEHNEDAIKSAQSVEITSFHYDSVQKDLDSLQSFLNKNI
jgi:8-oxo-dGTP diphosphatase